MKKFTFVLSLLVMLVTTAMAQKAHQRVSHDGWVVTAPNEAGVNKNEGGVAFIADDDAMTFYHSNWSSNYADGTGVNKGKDGLQAFMVELPTSVSDISLISYTGRSDNNSSGWARGVRIYVYETLPTGWPAGGLSSLSYTEKQELLKSDNANLGEPAFDNNESLWANDRTTKWAMFETPVSGKYVLFVMDSGTDKWLTCSDFQIYQSKDYSVKEKSAYILKVTNAASEGDWYIDTKTANADNQGLSTVAISQTAVETYFAWGENGWKISTNENVDGNYVGVTKWCAPPLQGTATEWQMLINDNEEIVLFQSVYYGDNKISRCFLGGDVTTNKSVVKLYTDNSSEKAITLSLIDASAKPVVVTYRVLFNGEVKTTQTVSTYIGANYPDVTVELPFGVSVVNKPEGEILLSDATEVDGVYTITKDLDVAVSLPFKYADSEANIKNWYYIQMHSSLNHECYLQYNAGNYIEWLDATRTVDEEDSYTWAFVGNPFDGLKLVNRAAPAGANAVTSAQDSGNPGFGSITDAVAWKIKASRINKDNEHFCFQYPGSSQYMNAQGGKVAFWHDNDQGSTMWVTERDFTMTADLQALIDQVDAAIVAYGEGGTTVGYYTAESVNNLLTVLAAAKVAVADPDRTIVTNKAAMANLNAAVAALKTIQPVAGQLYTIKNAYSSVYMNVSDEAGATTYYGDAALNEAFVFEPAAEDGKFYLYNCKRAKYLSSAPAHAYGQVQFKADNKENAKVVTVANLGVANRVSIVPEGGTTIHHDQTYSTVVGWTGDANSRSAWIIEEVANPEEFAFDVTVGEVGYATLYLGCNVTIPEGVEAYIVKGLQGGHALLTAIEGGVICAKTPVILKKAEGQPAEATKYSFKYASAASNVSDNLLLGTTVNTDIEGNAYVLGVIDEKVGLYKAKTTDGKFKNNAHKAYLYIDGAASSAGYRFDFDGTTGITEVETENANDAVIYDLTGRRVQEMNRAGIYIVNGKKVLVK